MGVAAGLANAWSLGLAKFANAPSRDRVCSIIVVPSLLNGSCFKKPGSVAQKYKLIQWVNAPQLPGENGRTWNWLMLKLMGPKMIEVKAPVQIIFFLVGCLPGEGGGVLPHISHMGMCHPKGYGFYTFLGGVFETNTLKHFRPLPNDSELHWLGLGNWVNQLSGQSAKYNDQNGPWFTQFLNPRHHQEFPGVPPVGSLYCKAVLPLKWIKIFISKGKDFQLICYLLGPHLWWNKVRSITDTTKKIGSKNKWSLVQEKLISVINSKFV